MIILCDHGWYWNCDWLTDYLTQWPWSGISGGAFATKSILPRDVEILNWNQNFYILIFSSSFCLYSLSDSVGWSVRNKLCLVSNSVLLRNTLRKSVVAYLSMIRSFSTYLTGQYWRPSISHIHCRERTGQSKIVWKYNIISYIILDTGT